nr:immunoglobulin heavy chain junction region [Macaca mulatta]MOX96412.1 immunoglobulin heavy chain junction region [Macaca mulatta]
CARDVAGSDLDFW